MRAYHSMPMQDFVQQIYEIAVKAGARPLVLDKIEELHTVPSAQEIEDEKAEAVEEAEREAHQWMWQACNERLQDVLESMDDLTREQRKELEEALEEIKPDAPLQRP